MSLVLKEAVNMRLVLYLNIIDHRYRSGKPLITTTNLPLKEIKGEPNIDKRRIYDRILERCVPLKINNQNIRELNAVANMSEARKTTCLKI